VSVPVVLFIPRLCLLRATLIHCQKALRHDSPVSHFSYVIRDSDYCSTNPDHLLNFSLCAGCFTMNNMFVVVHIVLACICIQSIISIDASAAFASSPYVDGNSLPLLSQNAVITIIATVEDCSLATSVYDDIQNIILATCDQGIIAVQLPDRHISLIVPLRTCSNPSFLTGDVTRSVAYAACGHGSSPDNPTSVKLHGPSYRNVRPSVLSVGLWMDLYGILRMQQRIPSSICYATQLLR
jgi:hypothetical protein